MTSKSVFPPVELKHLFEMMVDTAEMNKPILALVLSRTIFEVMIDGLLYRLMECRYTEPEIIDSVMSRVPYKTKLRIIADITGKKPKELAKLAGYDGLMATLEELNTKRNDFLHDGIATKPVKELSHKNYQTIRAVPLSDEDLLKTINFAIDTIGFFAKTFSNYGKPIDLHEKFFADY